MYPKFTYNGSMRFSGIKFIPHVEHHDLIFNKLLFKELKIFTQPEIDEFPTTSVIYSVTRDDLHFIYHEVNLHNFYITEFYYSIPFNSLSRNTSIKKLSDFLIEL